MDKYKIYVTRPDLPKLETYIKYLKQIWETRWLTNNGEYVQLFEKRLMEYLGVKNLSVVSNATLGLHIAIKALGLTGEVITTAYTFAATTNVLIWEGLAPVFADIDPETLTIDPEDVKEKITDKTTAILAVHTYGNPCYVKKLKKIAKEYNLKLIYDAAAAFGVEYEGKSVLRYGDVSVLSFHATKVFHTIEGGAIVSKNKEIHEKVKLLRNHGIKSEEEVLLPGTNAKMNEFQAAMGLANLETFEENVLKRKRLYELYKEELSDYNIKFQKIIASKYNYAYMPVIFENEHIRNKVYSVLEHHGIKARKYFYPITTEFEYLKDKGLTKKYNLKNSLDISRRVLALPLYPELSEENILKISKLIVEVVK